MGDPTGIGPEIIVKAIANGTLHEHCCPIVVGRGAILKHAATLSKVNIDVIQVDSVEQWQEAMQKKAVGSRLWCLETGDSSADQAFQPVVDARGGQAAYDCLLRATDLAINRRVDAIVTAPLHKVALQKAGHEWPGHTELLACLCGVKEYAMMLYLPPGRPRHGGPAGFGVVHVTLHIALREIFENLSTDAIVEKIRLACEVFTRIRISMSLQPTPRIAVAALNPHCGESGRFGNEEKSMIAPAVAIAQQMGIDVVGPLSVDTLMPRAVDGDFDAVVAMYHDQGHIAVKLLDMFDAVNVTLGLPIIRTSVAHGTAHDIAWQNKAEPSGMVQAVLTAARMAVSR